MRSQYRETVVDDPQNPVIFWNDPETGSEIVVTTFPAPGFTVEEVVAKDIHPEAEWYVCEHQQLPERQIFRNAWRLRQGRIEVDLEAARTIAEASLRDVWWSKIRAEGLDLPEVFLSDEEKTQILGYAASFRQQLSEVRASGSVQALYGLQDQGYLHEEPID